MIIESGLVKTGLVKTGLVRAISNINTRYYRRNEGTTDYATTPEVTLAGDQRWEFDLLTTISSGVGVVFSGQSSVDRWYIAVENGKPLIGNGVDRVAGGLTVNDGLFHRWVFEVVSNTLTVTVDGLTQYSDAVKATLPKSVRNLMADEAGSFILSGILANLKIYDNGTLIRDYPLDDNSDILRNRATVLGGELYGEAGQLQSAASGAQSLGTGIFAVANTDYIVRVVYENIVGNASLRTGVGVNESLGPVITGSGESVFILSALDSSEFEFIGRFGGVTSGVVTTSIRQADGYGTVINGNADDWGLFQEQATGEWLGQELVTQAVWENPAVVGAQWSLLNGLWSLSGDGSANSLRLLPTVDNPDTLRISGNLLSLSGIGLAVDNNLSAIISSIGTYSFDLNKSDIGVLSYLRSSGIVSATIDKPSIKEVLNVA